MRSEWPLVRLGDYCLKIGSGATPRGGQKSYLVHGPVALIRSQNIYNEGFQPEGLVYISEEQAAKLDNVKVEPGDVLINITGDSVARVCSAPSEVLPARVNQHVAIVRPHPERFDARYLRYFLASPNQQELLLSLAGGGGTRKALTKGMLENLQVPMPPLKVQQLMVEPLEFIDQAIEQYRRQNATLESIPQAIFKSWFIDFDPVHAKVAGQEPIGMDAETGELFPSEFETANSDQIPKGWTYHRAEELFNIAIGKTPPRREHHWFTRSEGVPWVSIRDMGEVDVYVAETTEQLTQGAIEQFNIRVVPDSTVLLSFKLTVGRVAITDGDMVTNEAIAHFRTKPDSPHPFHLYLYLKHLDYGSLGNTSSIAQALNSRIVRQIPILVPPPPVLESFGRYVEPLFESIRKNGRFTRTLRDLHDTLLPRLISGKLPIPEAEEIVEEAVS